MWRMRGGGKKGGYFARGYAKKREIYTTSGPPVYSYKISVQIVKSVHKSRVRCREESFYSRENGRYICDVC